MTPDRVIGRDGKLPWRLRDDMKFFKETTTGHPVVMGRKTFESLPKPLPDRQNIVLTRDPGWSAEGAEVIHALHELPALRLMDSKVYVIGGAQIYELFLPHCDDMLVSWVWENHEGDTRFPEFENYFPKYKVLDTKEHFEIRRYRKF
jgi:dihydrofolate reductase